MNADAAASKTPLEDAGAACSRNASRRVSTRQRRVSAPRRRGKVFMHFGGPAARPMGTDTNVFPRLWRMHSDENPVPCGAADPGPRLRLGWQAEACPTWFSRVSTRQPRKPLAAAGAPSAPECLDTSVETADTSVCATSARQSFHAFRWAPGPWRQTRVSVPRQPLPGRVDLVADCCSEGERMSNGNEMETKDPPQK